MSLTSAFEAFNYFVLGYFVVLNSLYLVLLYYATRAMLDRIHTSRSERVTDVARSPLTPGVSVVVPAFNEAAGIAHSVRSLLSMHYRHLQVVVVNDGSVDETMDVLRREFSLEAFPYAYVPVISTQPVRAVYRSTTNPKLLVVDKENGGKADALNCGINVTEEPLVCSIDADSILDEDALLLSCRPFIDEPERTVAMGGIVRVGNGCTIEHGQVLKVELPRSALANMQVVEYLRAFLSGRIGWSHINALLIISGAFGVFRRDVLQHVGGYATDSVGEDGELVVRIHRVLRAEGRDYRIGFVPDPVCWTEAPEKLGALRRQRTRWQRGLFDMIWLHRVMLFNPRYGAVGMIALPFALCFELLGPVIEIAGLIAVPVAWHYGIVNTTFLILFLVLSVLFGVFLSVAALALEEVGPHRYPRLRQLFQLLMYAVIENVGFRQLTSAWRAWGLVEAILGKRGWGDMKRAGMGAAAVVDDGGTPQSGTGSEIRPPSDLVANEHSPGSLGR